MPQYAFTVRGVIIADNEEDAIECIENAHVCDMDKVRISLDNSRKEIFISTII